MEIVHIGRRSDAIKLKTLLAQCMLIVIVSVIIALLLHSTLIKYLDIYHTLLELICVFISLSIFISVWYTYDMNAEKNYALGFGYLAVAIFDAFHTFYHLKLDLNIGSYYDLSTKYWILGRMAEAIILLLSVRAIKARHNKWPILLSTLVIAFGTAAFMIVYADRLPVLLTQQGVTPLKVSMEYAIISILGVALFLLRRKITERYAVTSRYIFIAIILAILSEICFTLYITVSSMIWTVGHILKIAAYFMLFRGIFISSVTYPYEKLEDEHKKLDIAFRQTQSILGAINNAIMMVDNNRKIILYNKALEDVFELDGNSIIGMDLSDLNNEIGIGGDEFFDLMMKDGDGEQALEMSLITMKGNKKDLLMFFTPIKNADGDVIGGISVSTDITDLKQEQQKMIQQEKLALLGQMGAGIVHETRNLLSVIKGRCQLIDMISDDENIKAHISKINGNLDEVNKIMSEFLFLSKPMRSEMTEVCISDIFESIQSMINSSTVAKGIDIEFKLSGDERYLLCDESQLRQVILNICKNAIDAMSDVNDAKLRIDSGFDETANEMYIKISDNGRGISKENLAKIGTAFFTTKSNGTGLGLNVCYQIIKQHKGKISVESEENKGTAFIINLPCIEDTDDDEDEDEVI